MAGFQPTELNAAADALASRAAYVSLHTGDPGTTGANEVTGGSPAYSREALTFPSAAGGVATSGQVVFDVPPGTYTHFGIWSAASAGTFRGGAALDVSQVISSQGEIKFTLTIPVTNAP